MIRLGEQMMILELHRRGLSITAIARRTGRDPKTVRKYVERGVEAPAYGPRSVGWPGKLAPYMDFVRWRVTAFPDLSAIRLTPDIRELGYRGAYTAVKRYLAAIRPENGPKPYELRFETPPGTQAQVDFARFVVAFTDDPGNTRIVWLFSLVLGHSRSSSRGTPSGSADAAGLPYPGVRSDGRCADQDPLRRFVVTNDETQILLKSQPLIWAIGADGNNARRKQRDCSCIERHVSGDCTRETHRSITTTISSA